MNPVARRVRGAPRTVARRVRGTYRRTPLRVKLVAIVVLLVIAALAGSGAIATATLRSYLVGRVDDQLKAAKQPTAEHQLGTIAAQHDNDHRAPDGDDFHLPSAFVIEVTDASGAVVYDQSNLVDSSEPLPHLPSVTGAQSSAAGTRTFTVRAVSGDDSWRVLATPITLADGTTGTLLIAQSLDEVQSTVDRLIRLFLAIGAVTVVVLAGVGYLVVRASLRPLRAVETTAARIAGGDLTHRVPDADPHTEVGRLSGALNVMLAEIEQAFAERAASENRMRRFVADASHELRTPLTSIRGFAELYRQGAVSEPQDVRRAMARIEDEAKRMGLLVEDLLLLARLDQERPLERAPVDMLALAGDAVHDAQATDPEREITLDIGPTDPPPVVTGDERRLRQVLANLVTNALQHTPPGTAVTVRVASRDGTVELDVADVGPGMTEEQAARVFERFYRADPARDHSAGGTGLGLAIVAALVAGHGGTVDVSTAPGAGTRFRVTLPLSAAEKQT
jgi:two-component system OmpR family sensor kinase